MSSSVSSPPPRLISDELWALVKPLIPPGRPAVHGRTGRPRRSDREVLEGLAFVLTDGLRTGDADDLDLWGEWEQSSYGRRQLTWSLGVHDLRKLADLGSEQSDEEIADEDLAGEDVIALPHPTWEALLRGELTTDLLDAAEIAGVEGACAFLALRDLEWNGGAAGPSAGTGHDTVRSGAPETGCTAQQAGCGGARGCSKAWLHDV